MDLIKNKKDNFSLGDVADLITGGKTKEIRDASKARGAQQVADSGQYFTLTPYQKSLIPIPAYVLQMVAGHGISQQAIRELPAQETGASNTQIIAQLKVLSGSDASGATASTAVANSGSGKNNTVLFVGIGAVILILFILILKKK